MLEPKDQEQAWEPAETADGLLVARDSSSGHNTIPSDVTLSMRLKVALSAASPIATRAPNMSVSVRFGRSARSPRIYGSGDSSSVSPKRKSR